ncbi:MAG: pyridine nucleotide-disulfide oxidoreductase [Pelagibacterium sp. SCN 64-44]|nr:MAG: pyridine nucleotide-disulfide oxidoreductase [Pelagibacterium sp. SCN 64-44]
MNDVVIIGGSFAGLAAALQLGRARRKVTVLDTGLPRNRFARHSHGFLGHDHKQPGDILAAARQQLARYETVKLVSGRATAITGDLDAFRIETQGGPTYDGRRVLLSYGLADRMPDIAGFAACWGQSIVPCPYCDGFEVAGRHWGLVYSGPMSQHMVSLYGDWTDRITVFANGHKLDGEARADLEARKATLVEGPISAISHADGQIETVDLADGRRIGVDVLFAHPGFAPAADLHVGLGLQLTETPLGAVLKTDERRETSVRGIYAAGDLANPMASVTLAASAGMMAAVFAQQSMLR